MDLCCFYHTETSIQASTRAAKVSGSTDSADIVGFFFEKISSKIGLAWMPKCIYNINRTFLKRSSDHQISSSNQIIRFLHRKKLKKDKLCNRFISINSLLKISKVWKTWNGIIQILFSQWFPRQNIKFSKKK